MICLEIDYVKVKLFSFVVQFERVSVTSSLMLTVSFSIIPLPYLCLGEVR